MKKWVTDNKDVKIFTKHPCTVGDLGNDKVFDESLSFYDIMKIYQEYWSKKRSINFSHEERKQMLFQEYVKAYESGKQLLIFKKRRSGDYMISICNLAYQLHRRKKITLLSMDIEKTIKDLKEIFKFNISTKYLEENGDFNKNACTIELI